MSPTNKEQLIAAYFPFWVFILLFKLAAGVHYAAIGAIGATFLPLWTVGLVVGSISFIECFLIIPIGASLYRIGIFRGLIIGILASLCSAFCLILPLTFFSYLASALFSGIAWLFFNPAVDSYLIATAPKQTVGLLFGIRRATNSLGISLGLILLPLLISLPSQTTGFVMIFPLIGSLASLLFQRNSLPCPPLQPSTVQQKIAATFFEKIFSVLRLPSMFMISAYTLFSSLLLASVWFWVPIFIETHPDSQANLGLLLLDAIVIFVGLPIGTFVDTHKKRPIVLSSIAAIATITFFLSPKYGLFFVFLCALVTIADEFASISLWSLFPKKMNIGLGTSVVTLMNDLGWTLGPIFAGYFLSHPETLISPNVPIGILGIFLLSATWLILPKVDKDSEKR